MDETDEGAEAFRKRLRDAYFDYQRRADRSLSQRELGERVASRLGRPEPFHPTAVNKWFKGEVFPGVLIVGALAEVLGVSRCWLAFGPQPGEAQIPPMGSYSPVPRTE